MTFREIYLTESKGTYAAVTFSQDDEDNIINSLKKLGIPNPVEKDDIHCTLLYSRKFLPNYIPKENVDEWAYPLDLITWKTNDKKKVLVLQLKCQYLEKRHKELMEEHQATYDFPDYIPHITLSYDIENFEIPSLSDFNFNKEFHIIREYTEDLNLDWKGEK